MPALSLAVALCPAPAVAATAADAWALAIKEGVYGDRSPELLETLESYALVLIYLDRAVEAQALNARAAAIRERLDGTP